ncbi:hypothetical protein KM043_012682 [Ampulex compressa]|nr:hypothetical protein KM043_012682 [Ampulex compressa]
MSGSVSQIRIGTHNGTFHCDEALACYLLKLLPRYKDATIVRTRDQSILDTCDIVVDVGGQYDPATNRYDHHMRDFNETVGTVIKKPGHNWDIKLSSAGLIYCHFGIEILREMLPKETSNEDIENVFKKVYDSLIKEVDAVDNGIPMYDGEPVYSINTGLSARVNRLNPEWNSSGVNIDEQFAKAMALTGEEFTCFVHSAANVWLPARRIVEDAVDKRFEVDPSGEIIALEQYIPWAHHLYAIEEEQNINPSIKYAILKDTNSYRVRAVPVQYGSFVCRIFLPEPWAGLRDTALEEASGIKGTIFVHTVRFIGGHVTKNGAIAMARKSLEIAKSNC